VPAKKIPYFKPSKELKDVVNNSGAASGLLLAGATEPVIFERQLCRTHRPKFRFRPPPSGSLDRIAIGIALDGSDGDDGKVTVLVNTLKTPLNAKRRFGAFPWPIKLKRSVKVDIIGG